MRKKVKRESEGSSRGNGIDANDAVTPSSPITRGALGQRLFFPTNSCYVFCFGASLFCICVCLCWENLQLALDLEGPGLKLSPSFDPPGVGDQAPKTNKKRAPSD